MADSSQITINGGPYTVLRLKKTDSDHGLPEYFVLYKLPRQQFKSIEKINGAIVTVEGLPEEEDFTQPVEMRTSFGYWSRHKDDEDGVYYKILGGLYDVRIKEDNYKNSIFLERRKLVMLAARFEALVDELVANKIIDYKKAAEIVDSHYADLLSTERIHSIYLKLAEIEDAEKLFE